MKFIVGLGNPGREYAGTRHNMGFMTIDRLAARHGTEVNENRFKALCGRTVIEGEKVLLVKPLTYMNNSGESVRAMMDFFKADPSDIIIIYDDIDLDPGQLRIRENGSAGSHNGMKSVIKHMGTMSFPRIRVGVGAKPEEWDLADYVLSKPQGETGDRIREGIENAAEAAELIIRSGMAEAMGRYNAKQKKDE